MEVSTLRREEAVVGHDEPVGMKKQDNRFLNKERQFLEEFPTRSAPIMGLPKLSLYPSKDISNSSNHFRGRLRFGEARNNYNGDTEETDNSSLTSFLDEVLEVTEYDYMSDTNGFEEEDFMIVPIKDDNYVSKRSVASKGNLRKKELLLDNASSIISALQEIDDSDESDHSENDDDNDEAHPTSLIDGVLDVLEYDYGYRNDNEDDDDTIYVPLKDDNYVDKISMISRGDGRRKEMLLDNGVVDALRVCPEGEEEMGRLLLSSDDEESLGDDDISDDLDSHLLSKGL